MFKVGDRVIINGIYDNKYFENEKGFILKVDDSNTPLYLIDFNSWNDGHDGNESPYGVSNRWWVTKEHITVYKLFSESNPNFKYAKIVSKIKAMEQKRQEKGYKTYQL